MNHFSQEGYPLKLRIKDDQKSILTKTSKTTKRNKPMVELTAFSALPKSTSVEIQTHTSSTNFNGKLTSAMVNSEMTLNVIKLQVTKLYNLVTVMLVTS